MQEQKAQMALRLHQITGEPLAHCSYLLDQTSGDYETALKILERIIQQRRSESADPSAAEMQQGSTPSILPQSAQTLEERVSRLENQLAHLSSSLNTMTDQLSLLLDKLAGPASDESQ